MCIRDRYGDTTTQPMSKRQRVEDDPTTLFHTHGGITVHRSSHLVDGDAVIKQIAQRLDNEPGAIFSSMYEFPGRYTRWDTGLVSPPLVLESWARKFELRALNQRGRVLLEILAPVLQRCEHVEQAERQGELVLRGTVRASAERFTEDQRSRQPSVMSLVRALVETMHSPMDGHLGLYGAFGYDLAHAFEPVKQARPRDPGQRDICLFLPDEILVTDRGSGNAYVHKYDFEHGEHSTVGLEREIVSVPKFVPAQHAESSCDHVPGEYASKVGLAKQKFVKGDLFEAVLSQTCLLYTSPSPRDS
eukprot:TRINITY_DN24250_c0_g1_i1.p1 TRINITY_DN24250_c0_g1~~TRINITY_DN24250_c0_g1_i1.p1  ORF type:complete len:303 (+),score=67.10 TRINITY_DN24250_c0_g1_i1:165-1073(+)